MLLRSTVLALLLILLASCGATGSISFTLPVDDEEPTADDDDATADDDDATADDDDATADDDDATEPPPCPGAVITCDQTISANNGMDGVAVMDAYSCVGGGITGPEVTYEFVATATGTVSISVVGLTDDLDVYILDGNSCDANQCNGGSWNGGIDDEEVSFDIDAGDIVTVVVDGWDGAVSDYTLMVSCGGGGDDDDDDDDAGANDGDSDGWSTGDDCDDNDATINPGALELCDTIDNDCSGGIDDGGACTGCTQGTYGGHTYQSCSDFGADFSSADTACSSFGYYLATIDDAGEDAFLSSTAQSISGTGSIGWWFGYTDQGGWQAEGMWYWIGPAAFGAYENWNNGEPNNSGNEDCAEMAPWSGWAWNDNDCASSNAFFCEGDF